MLPGGKVGEWVGSRSSGKEQNYSRMERLERFDEQAGACIRTFVLYGVETWLLKLKLDRLVDNCDFRMLRYIPSINWKEGFTNEEVLEN